MGGIESDFPEPEPDDFRDSLYDVNAPEPSEQEQLERLQAKRRHPSVDGLPKTDPQPPPEVE